MLNQNEFAKAVSAASKYLATQQNLEEEFRKLGEWGQIGLIGACILAGHDTDEAIAIQAQKLVSPRSISNIFWLADKGTGVTRQRRLWFRKSNGRYALRDS